MLALEPKPGCMLERRENVPVIGERALRFERGKAFARVYGRDGGTVEREVQLGVSDGIQVGERVAVIPATLEVPH